MYLSLTYGTDEVKGSSITGGGTLSSSMLVSGLEFIAEINMAFLSLLPCSNRAEGRNRKWKHLKSQQEGFQFHSPCPTVGDLPQGSAVLCNYSPTSLRIPWCLPNNIVSWYLDVTSMSERSIPERLNFCGSCYIVAIQLSQLLSAHNKVNGAYDSFS